MRSSYSSSKAAINGLTAALAVEWSKYGININSIAWGGVDINQKPISELSEIQKKTLPMVPMERLANQNDLLGPVVFLISDASNYINGQTIMVDGGWSVLGKSNQSGT